MNPDAQALRLARTLEKEKAVRDELAEVAEKIESYAGGDRPPSPPVHLLQRERQLRAILSYYETHGVPL